MKYINEYILEKLHLNKGMQPRNDLIIVITGYGKIGEISYEKFESVEDAANGIITKKLKWHAVYGLRDSLIKKFSKMIFEKHEKFKKWCNDNNVEYLTQQVRSICMKLNK